MLAVPRPLTEVGDVEPFMKEKVDISWVQQRRMRVGEKTVHLVYLLR
jgi:hypothetical protein